MTNAATEPALGNRHHAADDEDERIVEAVTPQVTDEEFGLIETIREMTADQQLVRDVRSGRLEG